MTEKIESCKMSQKHDIVAMLEGGLEQVRQYEAFALKTRAKHAIPVHDIHELATRKVLQDRKKHRRSTTFREAEEHEFTFLQELSRWFKDSYFTWVNSPNCEKCGCPSRHSQTTRRQFNEPQLPYSARANGHYVIDVELHQCTSRACKHVTLFPRHTDAAILLNTRRGRCSEWAQVFTLMCRSLGYRVRLVLDVTDHVWTEVYSFSRRKWVHIDACEAAVDQPLMYERGWGKKLSYVVAVGVDDVQDVSWRYSADHSAMKTRRDHLIDAKLLNVIVTKRKEMKQKKFIPRERYELRYKAPVIQKNLLEGVIAELVELWSPPAVVGDYGSRTSGDKDWIQRRSEDGSLVGVELKGVVRLTSFQVEPMWFGTIALSYQSNLDAYVVSHDEGTSRFDGWQAMIYKHTNIQHKREHDWGVAYLARQSASSQGEIEWHFDAAEMIIHTVHINAGIFIKESGNVNWIFQDQDRKSLGEFQNVDRISLDLLAPISYLIVRVTLSSAPDSPDIAWQHTQLFRMKMDDPLPPPEKELGFTFTLVRLLDET